VLESTTRVPASLDRATGVFDRFHSADPRCMHNRGGAALGLAITAASLEAHHGRIPSRISPASSANATLTVSGTAGSLVSMSWFW
jgi:signal transduction histidine kinase